MSLQKVIFEILDENVDRLSLEIYVELVAEICDEFIGQLQLIEGIELDKLFEIKSNFEKKVRDQVMKNIEDHYSCCQSECGSSEQPVAGQVIE